MAKKNTTREFSYKRPIILGGSYYPSADTLISDENGNSRKGIIFTDANGGYYTLDNNHNVVPVMSKYDLDDVVVNAKDKREPILFNRYLTRNDKTQVNKLPHREYNTSLKANAERGAKEHALWDREHPNLASWRDAATAVPFAVAATPLVLGTSQGLMGTAIGQTAKHGITALMENPYVAGVNDAIGLGFVGKGAYDVSQGKFTPETAMDFMGGAGLMYKGLNAWDKASMAKMAARNASRRIVENSELGNNTRRGLEDIDLTRDNILVPKTPEVHSPLIEANQTASSLPAPAQEEMNIPARLLSDYEDSINMGRESWQTPARENSFYDNLVADARIQGTNDPAIQELNAMADNSTSTTRSAIDDIELPFDPVTGAANPNYVSPSPRTVYTNWQDEDLGPSIFDTPLNEIKEFKARNSKAGEAPYTDEEINALLNEDDTLKDGIYFTDKVQTGSHGKFFDETRDTPTSLLQKYLYASDPAVKRREMKSIMEANPKGRSGILIDTHDGDTSMDSTPLAYKMATRLGTKFKPLAGKSDRVISNNFGYVNAFKQGYGAEADRARALFEANPSYEAKLLRDSNNNMIAFESEDENGLFQIPLNTREETLGIMNNDLHKFNEYYDTNYPDIVPHKIFSKAPWSFGQFFDLPNIYGIAYKKGGKLKRRLLTQL